MIEPNEPDGMTTAPKFVPDNNTPAAAPPEVPQWLYDASTEVSARRMGVLPEYVLEIIASHAPQPEAKEVAVLESMLANEEQACMEVLKERDTAIGFCDLFAATILGEDINWSCHETKWQEALDMLSNGKTIEVSGIMLRRSGDYAIVEAEVDGKWKEVIREFIDAPFSHIVEPSGIANAKESELNSVPDGVEAEAQPATATEGEEATGGGFRTSKAFTAQAWKDHGEAREPEAMTKWPRYLENAEHRGIYSRRMFDSPTHLGRWCDGSDSVLELTFDEVMAEGGCIETDAAGNALPASPPATNFTRHAEPKNYLSVCNQCRTKFDATGKCDCDRVSVSCQMPTLSEQPGSASGVETMKYTVKRMGTFGGSPLYTATFQVHGEMQVVTAADHDRLLAERDGEIATLRTRLLRAEQRDAEAEKYASGISENLSGFLQLAELGCSVHRNAVVNRPRYYVADVDGKIVSEADEILAAMRNVAMPFNNGG